MRHNLSRLSTKRLCSHFTTIYSIEARALRAKNRELFRRCHELNRCIDDEIMRRRN